MLAGESMAYRRTVVLGGSGFIGRYVVRRLAARGDVVAVGCRNAEEAKFLKPMGNVGQIATLNVSIGDAEVLPAFLAGNDALVNCVGILRESGRQTFDLYTTPGRRGWLGWRATRASSALRTSRRSAPIRARPRPMRAARRRANRRCATPFRPSTILRPSVVFGPEDQFFNQFATIAMVSPVLPLIGGGETRMQPVYVDDVAAAVMSCLEEPAATGRTYELGGPKVYTLRELLELMLVEIRRKRLFVNLPFGLATLQARLMSLLPDPPLTPDQVELLETRQCRLVERDDAQEPRHRRHPGRSDPAHLSRPLSSRRLVRASRVNEYRGTAASRKVGLVLHRQE